MNYRDMFFHTCSLFKDGEAPDTTDVLLNAALGLAGESGEFADLIKKHLFQGHALDTVRLIKELGDIRWYLEEACVALGVTLEDIEKANIEKLLARYPNGFNPEQSQNRKPTDN